MNKLIYSYIFFSVCLISSCNKRPEGVLGEREMIGLIADMEVAESYMQTQSIIGSRSDMKESLTEYVLNKHNITKAEFDSTMTWYGKNIDEYQKLYSKVDKELMKRQQKYTGSDDIKTNDLWQYSRHLVISEKGGGDNLAFSIPVSDVDKGDKLIWKMRLRSNSNGNLLFGVDYDNGTTSYISQNAMGNKKINLSLQTDTGKQVKRIYGYFRIDSKGEMPLWVDSISIESVPYDSLQYYNINIQRNYKGPVRKSFKNVVDTVISDTIGKKLDHKELNNKTPETIKVNPPENSGENKRRKNVKPRPVLKNNLAK